jgi:hypothetical protein
MIAVAPRILLSRIGRQEQRLLSRFGLISLNGHRYPSLAIGTVHRGSGSLAVRGPNTGQARVRRVAVGTGKP